MPSPATEGERGWEGTLSGERVERRLTALLAADVVGYSRADGRRRRRHACGAESDPARVGRSVDRRASRPAMSRRRRRPRCRQVPSAGSEKGGTRSRWRRQEPPAPRLRRAWNDEHASATGPSSVRKRKCIEQGGRSGCGSVPSMVHNDGLPPLMTRCPLAEIRRATGLSTRYVIMIRKGLGIQPQETISILVAKRSKVSIRLN